MKFKWTAEKSLFLTRVLTGAMLLIVVGGIFLVPAVVRWHTALSGHLHGNKVLPVCQPADLHRRALHSDEAAQQYCEKEHICRRKRALSAADLMVLLSARGDLAVSRCVPADRVLYRVRLCVCGAGRPRDEKPV